MHQSLTWKFVLISTLRFEVNNVYEVGSKQQDYSDGQQQE